MYHLAHCCQGLRISVFSAREPGRGRIPVLWKSLQIPDQILFERNLPFFVPLSPDTQDRSVKIQVLHTDDRQHCPADTGGVQPVDHLG